MALVWFTTTPPTGVTHVNGPLGGPFSYHGLWPWLVIPTIRACGSSIGNAATPNLSRRAFGRIRDIARWGFALGYRLKTGPPGWISGAGRRYRIPDQAARNSRSGCGVAARLVSETRPGRSVVLPGPALTRVQNFPDIRSGIRLQGFAIRRGPVVRPLENH